jgi:O-antigen/teichoic acid export membrane protein
MSARRSVAWMALAQGSLFVLQFGGSVVLARLLSPYDMGIFAIALALTGLISIIQAFGLGNFIVRERELSPSLLATTFTVNALMSLLLAALVAALGLFGAAWLHEDGVRRVLLVLAIQPLFGILEFLPNTNLERNGEFKPIAGLKTLRAVASTGLTVTLAFQGWSYMSLAWGQVFGAAVGAVAVNLIAPHYASFKLSLAQWRPVTRFGVQMLAISGVNMLSGRLSEIALGRIIDLAALGLYSRASSLFNLLWNNIHIVVTRIVLVDFSNLARDGTPLRERYIRIVALMTALLWPAFAGLAILAGPFIYNVYGAQWIGAAMPLSMLSISAILLVSITMTWEVFVVAGETDRQARFEFVRTGVGLALFIAGCFVSLTTAAASRIGEALFSLYLYKPHLERMTQTRPKDLRPVYLSSGLATLAAVLPAAGLMTAFHGSERTPLAYVLASVALGALAWLGALKALRHPLMEEIGVAFRLIQVRFAR